jgi:hypothetical protein
MTIQEKFEKGWNLMMEACKEGDYGDPFSYARSREILMAIKLGHTVAPTLSGADGFDSDGECEYKSTIADSINATYNGISVFETWDAQVDYLINEKIKKYKNHYFARFTTDLHNPIAEVWRMDGDVVYDLLLPKLKNKYLKENKGKDPRLGASLSKKQIYEYGERIL